MNGTALVTETLQWHDANQRKPDSDITVLCWDGETPFFCGYWDDSLQGWIGCESGGSVLWGVTHWSEPTGPDARVQPLP